MKKHLLLLIVLGFLVPNCTKTATAPVTAPSVGESETIEGTVFYFVGGGTVEMPYPAGYRLLYAHWVTQSPDSSAGPVYLNGIVDSSFVNKHVRVTGLTEVDSAHGTAPGYTYSWVKITVQSIQVIP